MKARTFLSDKSVTYLKGVDLSAEAEELHNALDNLLTDLPHYLLRLDTGSFSNENAIVAFGRMVYTAGARYKTPGVNLRYRKTYKDLVIANSFDLGRELACIISPIMASKLLPKSALNAGTEGAVSKGTRTFQHKAWLHSKWEGDEFEGMAGFIKAMRQTSLAERKKVPTVAVGSVCGTMIQQGSCFHLAGKSVQADHHMLVNQRYTVYEELHVLSAGIGSFTFNETKMPIFNLDAPCDLYVVAENTKGLKYIIGFPDTRVLAKAKDLKVVTWSLNRVCTSDSKLRFVLEGVNEQGTLVIACHGMSPFYMPEVIRG